ncbi:MAG: DNA primase [Bacteroidota bacterium]|nr:DNA primase [Bacteroidota bacterium]
MRLPPEKIEEIRNSTDIVELIGAFVKLKKRGKNYVGLCPFHNEKTPSFTVSSDKQMYHCFGCGVGGNSISFMMESEKISFIEAVKSLAEKAGISLPVYTPEYDAIANEQEELYSACKAAGLFFYHNLTETSEGKFAQEYFHKRGFSNETIRTFGLGYSPNSWDSLIKHAERENIPLQTLEKAGLVRKRDDGSYYDYFRGRAMFPIFSSTGRTVGFGARKLYEDDQLGKYLNSPETLIYNKSRILYGISHAKEAIREKDYAVLVEGYADLIRVYQEGIRNIVASSGTSLTVEQIQSISRYTKNITIVYDADSAGSKAAMRGVDLILEKDLDVRVAVLPQGDDPDSFVGKYGGEKFLALLKYSVSFVDFIAQAFEREGYLKTPEGQTKAVRTIIQTISKIKDGIKRNFYIQLVAEKYGLYESLLHQELEKYIKIEKSRSEYQLVRDEIDEAQLETDTQNLNGSKKTVTTTENIPLAERDILHAMIDGGRKVTEFVFSNFSPEQFSHPYAKILAQEIHSLYETADELNAAMLIDSITETPHLQVEEIEAIKKLLTDLVFSQYELSKRWAEEGTTIIKGDAMQIARDALRTILLQTVQKKLEVNQQSMKEASKRGEDVSHYLQTHTQLLEEKKFLSSEKCFQKNEKNE